MGSVKSQKPGKNGHFPLVAALALTALAAALVDACGSGSETHKVPPEDASAGEGGAPDHGGSGGHAGGNGGHAGLGGSLPAASGEGGAPSTSGAAGEAPGASGAGGAAGASSEGGAAGDAGAPCADGALSFSGSQFVQIPGTESLDLKTALTLEAWIKTSSPVAVESLFLAKHSCGADNGYFLEIYTNSSDGAHVPNAPAFYVAANTNHAYGLTSIVDGKWHHVAGTWTGTTSTLYVDGAFVASKAVATMNTNTVDLVLGAATTGACRNYTGLMDEVSVWSVARTAQQIAADAGGPIDKNAPGLEAYFDFNAAACGKTLADRSPHARNGLLGGSTDVTPNDPVWVSDGPF